MTTLSVAGVLAFAVPALADGSTSAASVPSPQKQCRSERSGMGLKTFRQTYGTNAKRSNAFGKCVSKRAKATEAAQQEAHTNAAKQCAEARSTDPAAFRAEWGTNHNGANAYGKCVSATARAMAAAKVKSEVKADVNAAESCHAARKADADAFAEKYGSKRNAFGKCVSQTAKALQDESSDSGQDS